MKLIVCVDSDNGMMFNNRRQSRDKALIEDIYKLIGDKKLWINNFSKELFDEERINLIIDEEFEKTSLDDFCFIENISLKKLKEKADEIIIYNWNRKYPADMYFDIMLDGFELKSEIDIKGSSHDKITQRIYKRGGYGL